MITEVHTLQFFPLSYILYIANKISVIVNAIQYLEGKFLTTNIVCLHNGHKMTTVFPFKRWHLKHSTIEWTCPLCKFAMNPFSCWHKKDISENASNSHTTCTLVHACAHTHIHTHISKTIFSGNCITPTEKIMNNFERQFSTNTGNKEKNDKDLQLGSDSHSFTLAHNQNSIMYILHTHTWKTSINRTHTRVRTHARTHTHTHTHPHTHTFPTLSLSLLSILSLKTAWYILTDMIN
jgi:hypothetical protein